MLVNILIPPNLNQDPICRMLSIDPEKVEDGVYVNCGYNLGNIIQFLYDRKEVDEWPDLDFLSEPKPKDEFDYFNCYGVCDTVEQFLSRYKKGLSESERKFVIGFTEVVKSEQPERGGWRWHKWGPYIGDKTSHYEYLYDEPDIESVFCYHVYELLI